jgi:putative solute:sodium symporter small subunit
MPLVEDVKGPGGPASAGLERGVDKATGEAYWRRTSSLMWIMLGIWAVAGFGVHLFANSLNAITVLGFPLGFYMAAQGSLIIFVVSLFWFASRQNAIDEEFGVEED